MNKYSNILVAIDLYADYDAIIRRALTLAQTSKDVSIIYVSMPSTYIQPYLYDIPSSIILDEDLLKKAQKKLADIAAEYDIAQDKAFVELGDPADEIQEKANQIEADLIVLGTHGRSGIKLLLGSTANAVMHGVKQDVLAVRIQD
ncbi:MAG: universal stress protein [Pseudomonadota bacterium]